MTHEFESYLDAYFDSIDRTLDEEEYEGVDQQDAE